MNIRSVNVVFEFEPDKDIVLTMGQNIKQLQDALNAKSQILSVPPMIPDEAPRIIVTFNNVLIRISLNRFDYMVEIPSHVQKDPEEAYNYVIAVIENVYKFLNADEKGYNWVGAVASVEFPCDKTKFERAIKAITPVFDKIINIDRNERELASFNLQYGFCEDSYYKNFTIAGYDQLQVEIKQPVSIQAQEPVLIDLQKDGEVLETGISIQVDFNNKPFATHRNSIEELKELISTVKTTTMDIVNITNLGGVLCE